MRVLPAKSSADIEQVRRLFEEYWAAFGFTPCFQNFAQELAGLPGSYSPPDGRLALARIGGGAAGCVALRRLDATRCEAKRLYVRPAFRGRGVGRSLMQWIIEEARQAGYGEMLGDTLPVMSTALEMYGRMGFELTAPHEGQPEPGAIYLRLRL